MKAPQPSRQVTRAGARRATKIQWTQRTWQVTSGCREWSPGCLNCYARFDARRMGSNPNEKVRRRYAGLVVLQSNQLRWSGEVRELPEQLHVPMHWRAPTTVFVNSLSDLFQEGVSFEYIAAVFGVMAGCARHTFQVLTKRPERMVAWSAWVDEQARTSGLSPQAVCVVQARGFGLETSSRDIADAWPLPNVWMGTSVEDQKRADERVPELLRVPAVVRFLSCEPLLEALDLTRWLRDRVPATDAALDAPDGATLDGMERVGDEWSRVAHLHLVIPGGESGGRARRCNVEWVRGLVGQCRRWGVPVFVKQLGARPAGEWGPGKLPLTNDRIGHRDEWVLRDPKGGDMDEWPADLRLRELPRRST